MSDISDGVRLCLADGDYNLPTRHNGRSFPTRNIECRSCYCKMGLLAEIRHRCHRPQKHEKSAVLDYYALVRQLTGRVHHVASASGSMSRGEVGVSICQSFPEYDCAERNRFAIHGP